MLPLIAELAENRLDIDRLPATTIEGLYVHIPFCRHKCHYCDFYSIVGQPADRIARFVDLLLTEARLWANVRQLHTGLRTIFFGGGTPSLLPLEDMRRLIVGLRGVFDFAAVDEFTIEVNPATTSLDYLTMLRSLGVTRISMGAQSFDRADLSMLERHHDPEDVPRSIELCRQAGFDRVNVDLIYAVPGQSLESWESTLARTLSLNTEHVSCYALTYEPNTPMTVKRDLGTITPTDESLELEMFRHTHKRLSEHGVERYEVSNFARPGEACRHNLIYWRGGSYLGLGPSAASHVSGVRFRNLPRLGDWEQTVSRNTLHAADVETLSNERRAGERVFLGLRLVEGVDLESIRQEFGIDLMSKHARTIDTFSRSGLIEFDGSRLRLTERGFELADGVCAEFVD